MLSASFSSASRATPRQKLLRLHADFWDEITLLHVAGHERAVKIVANGQGNVFSWHRIERYLADDSRSFL